ncbi:MATH and LRR domain-containing protein PFE0570w-like [Rhopalosiphum maidis]|uniref:MATH and LRR domain-containing protein PFE0570w-like n=1 Tax=Rhopalosiphum maidis TaxID=43146 RepID=UPI000EFDC50C|nr:MATH and LRR domain-containing protein PFE0570w-like [Rhopalosiphum maidis]
MSSLRQVMQVIGSHHISNQLLESDCDKSGGLISNGEYAWFAAGANIILYSKRLGSIVSSRSFAANQKDKSLTITFVQELHKSKETTNLLLVGCSFKSSGILFVCQLPTLTTIRCIHIPNPISYISTIKNKTLAEDQLCDEFKVMSTVLLVGMATGAVFAIDLRQQHIENQLRRNEIVVNELRPSKLFIIRKNEDCQEVKEMSDDSDCHLAIFINENFCIYCKKQYSGKLNFSISSLFYNEEINTVAIGYSTGHFQLWDCKMMRTIYLLKEPKCVMPVTHITFLEPSDDPNNLCYLWIIQSDNSRLPNATMIALTYEQRTMMSNGCFSYKVYKGNGIKLEMSLRRETGIGRCISALSLCNVNLSRNETDMDEDCEIRLFAMLMEIRQNVDASPESYIFLFDINQWYKAQMPSNINHLKVSNSYASFVKLPHIASYLDLNISDKTLRPFGYNFRNNVEELYYPSSIYFECDCLLDNEIIRFKHAGVQQEILDQLLLKNWRLLINPTLIFSQCLQTNLRPFFWDKTDDYVNYSLPDKRSFVISIIVENKIMSVLSACAEEWKNGTYVSSEATILHLVQCLWKHVMVVKQYADKLCVPLFDYSGTQLGKKNERILNHCLSQMLCVKHFLEDLHNAYGIHIINVDYSYRVYTLNLVTQYFKAVTCFLSYGLLPESIEEDPTRKFIKCDFSSLIQYAIKRRMEFGDLPFYLIDAFVNNEPKGNKLIEQWQHEGGEATKGLYPPSNVQCLLRIYLNAALSNQIKDFITIYFLIDICSSQEIDVITANRMCNFAIEFDIENKGLNTLCRASWLIDHDMFEEAMEILASNNEWMVNDKSWDWYHWTVLKLLVFRKKYFWARFYLQLTKINLVNIEDHKFYINLQIMDNQCFDTLIYLRERPFKEKQTLFDYFFDRCRETKKLKCLIEYLWETEEAELFLSFLKRFDDTETLIFQVLFLLQQGRHREAIKLNQTLKVGLTSNNNDALKITSVLIDGLEKTIPDDINQNYSHHLRSIYSKPDVVMKCMNNESKMFIMDMNKTSPLVKRKSESLTPSNSIDLFLPANTNLRKRSPIDDVVTNEKRRKLEDNSLSTPNTVNEIVKPIEKHVLEILNTPLVEKTISSPSITSYSSILKMKLAANNKQILSPRSSIRFSLPCNDDATVKRNDPEEVVNIQLADNPENESFYSVGSSDVNDLTNQTISDQIPIAFQESIKDNSKINMSNEYEKMDISEENSCSEQEQFEIDDVSENEIKNKEIVSNLENDECIMLTSDEEDDKEMPVLALLPKNTSSTLKEDIKLSTPKFVSLDENKTLNPHSLTLNSSGVESDCLIPDMKQNIISNEKPLLNEVTTDCLKLDTNSNDYDPVLKTNKNIDVILLDSEDEHESDILSDSSYSEQPSDSSVDSDLENTRYGRFKSQKRQYGEDSNDDELGQENEEEENEEDENEEDENENEEEENEEEEIENDIELDISRDISEQDVEDSEDDNVSVQYNAVCEESNLKHPCLNDLDQQSVKFDENNEEKVIYRMTYFHGNEETGSENNVKRNDDDNCENNSGHVLFINEDEDNDLEISEYVKNDEYSDNVADESYNINEDNLKDSDVIVDDASDENNSAESDIIIDDSSDDENNSEKQDENEEKADALNVISDDGLEEYNLDEPTDTLVSKKVENLEEPVVIVDDASEENNSEELNVTSEGNDSEEQNYIIDDASEENSSEESDILLDSENEEKNSEAFEDSSDHNNSEESESDIILDDECATNNLKSFETLKSEKTLEKNELVDSDKMMDPIDTQSNSLVNLAEETHSNNENQISNEENENSESIIVEDDKTNDIYVLENDDNVIKVVENTEEDNKESLPVILDDVDNKDDLCFDQNEDNHCDEYASSNKYHSFETSRNESNPIPDDGFNHLTMTGIESDQIEMDVNQSTPFMFGESFFGQQEIPEQKPMLLFGHVYSSENEQLNVNVQVDKLETQELVVVNTEEDNTNKELEVEAEGEIQDILELESLPESNPDDNIDTQNIAETNNLQPEFKEANETLSDDGQNLLLGNSSLQKPIYFGNIDCVQVFEIEEQTPNVSVNLSKESLELENEDLTNQKSCDLLTIKQINQSVPNESEDQFKTEGILPNDVETFAKNSVNTIETTDSSSCIIVDDVKTCSISQRNIETTTQPKYLKNIINTQDEELNSKCTTSVVSCSSTIEQFDNFSDNDHLVKSKDIALQQVDTNVLTSTEEKCSVDKVQKCYPASFEPSLMLTYDNPIDKSVSEKIELPIENVVKIESADNTIILQCPDVPSNTQNFDDKKELNLAEKLDRSHQKKCLVIPQVENYSLRSSSRRSISKIKNCCSLDVPSKIEKKLTCGKINLLSDPIQEDNSCTPFVIEQIKKAKSIPSVDTKIITTRSRAKSEPKQVQLETISSNIFRSSDMVEDNSRQVRVSLSKKKSKSQGNISSIKRRSGRSKSLAPVEESIATNRRTVFGLEEIPEEDTSNAENNIPKTESAALKRKSKFNFLTNASKKIEHNNLSTKCQQNTKIRTPRRSKSVEPDPVLTFSVVKKKPKRSSSVNILISNEEISTQKDDLIGVLKKALNSPKKIRKRSVSESLKSRKKQKILNEVEEEKKEVAESELNSNESYQSNHNSNSSYSCEQLSPIAGNISQHMLYTPAKKRSKIRMANLNSENEDSSSDESTDSKRIMTRSMIQNSSNIELDPIHRTIKSEIRPPVKSKVPINRPRKLSVSNTPKIKSPKKSATTLFEKEELLPKRKAKNIKETIVHAPIEPAIVEPPTSERRMTRSLQSILDKSLQSTSIIGQDTTINNTTVPKPEKKRNVRKTNLKKN